MQSVGVGHGAGKVILLGEHAVVYGVPALAAGIRRGARASARVSEADEILFNGTSLAPEHELYPALRLLRSHLNLSEVRLELDLMIPAGSGLGGSAALGVSTLRALAQLGSAELSERESLRLIDEWENLFHGKASGVDARASYYGSVIRFVRGEEPLRIPLRRPVPLVVALAAPPASTKLMVEAVARLRDARREAVDKTLSGIHALVDNATIALRNGDLVGLGRLMDLNHMLLGTLLLSTEEIESACAVAREAGALGAKLTGSGGGGAIIALAPSSPERIVEALAKAGFPAFVTTIDNGPS